MANAVTLTFAGDSKSLDKTMTDVRSQVDQTGRSFSNQSGNFDGFNDHMGKVTKTAKGVKDTSEGLIMGMTALGVSFPGEQAIAFAAIAFDLAKGAKDLSEGLGGALSSGLSKVKGLMGMSAEATEANTVATEEGTVASDELNASLLANPIGLIIGTVALLAVGFYELWQHCTTFRDGVKEAFAVAKAVVVDTWDWIKDHWPLLLAILTGPVGLAVLEISKHWDSIKGGASTLLGWFKSGWQALKDVISAPFTAAFDAIKTVWNETVGGFGIHIPSFGIGPFHTPGVDFTIPKMMANGGRPTGPTIVGERGAEMFVPDGPGTIVPLRGGGFGGGGTHVTVDFSGVSSDALINALRQGIKIRGGNVQTALGVGY
jgi:phage-related protein